VHVNVQTDRSLIRPVNSGRRYALVTFSAPDAGSSPTRQPVNVAFVLDRSGSMGGGKISLAKQALGQALRLLRPSDRFAVVFYDNQIDLVVPSTPASAEAIDNAINQVAAIEARGSTDLGGGWLRGCEQVAQHLDRSQIAKCLLLTDGLANQGIRDTHELQRHARELRTRGIATSTLGLGQDFNEDLLQKMADAGGGRSYYIETAVQIADTLTSELGETLETVARGAGVRVTATDGVDISTLNAFECRRLDSRTSEIRIGDLVSRQAVSLVVQLRFPSGVIGTTSPAAFSLFDEAGTLATAPVACTWTYASDADNDRQPRNVVVDRAVASLYAGKAREEALALNRDERFADAQRRLKATADRIRRYAGVDTDLKAIIAELAERHVVYGQGLADIDKKREIYASYNRGRMRDAYGKARRD
jgi:Ca-activated chloride channel family protein